MSWGIADTAPEIEKIKAESADYLNGLNSCGVIDYGTYSYAFDFYADLIDKAYSLGKKESEWTLCSLERQFQMRFMLHSRPQMDNDLQTILVSKMAS